MPRGIAAHYAPPRRWTSEPTTGREKGRFRIGNQRGEKVVQVMVRIGALTRQAESPVREACRSSAIERQLRPESRVR
jgi:hypothetical protein